jgi:hypothetical protein
MAQMIGSCFNNKRTWTIGKTRAELEPATLRLTAEVVEILNALSCVAYRETQAIFGLSVGLLGLPAIDSVTPATKLDWEIGVGPKTRALTPK